MLASSLDHSAFSRFWSRVDVRTADECWLWLGRSLPKSYGRFRFRHRREVYAHRFALFAATGFEPFDLLALHRCDNRRCCNPRHLYWGTHRQNMDDKATRRRWSFSLGFLARHMAMRHCRECFGLSIKEVASSFGVSFTTAKSVLRYQLRLDRNQRDLILDRNRSRRVSRRSLSKTSEAADVRSHNVEVH